MRYAISYVSTANPTLSQDDIKNLLEKATERNNARNITGLLLASETNFFQLIEGDEEEVKYLYTGIEKDYRHNNLIKIIEKTVFLPAYDGYVCGMITEKTKYDSSKLESYLHYIEVLDPVSRKAVTRVIEAILI